MAHELARFRSKLFDTPLLVDSKSFESILNYVDKRCGGTVDVVQKEASNEFSMYSTLHYAESNLGVIHISGPLTNKSTGWEALCGGTSYESIKEDFEALAEAGVKTIAFMAESGGGEAYGMMDTGNYLRKLADENGIRIISYVDGLAASACYGLIAISDEIISNKSSEIGSVGVLIRLLNDSKSLEMKGYERSFISAGKEKIPYSEDGSFRKEFLDDLQYKVDALYTDFTEYVAEHRNLSVEAVRNTQANTFLADDAVNLGLADKVMTQEDFYSYLSGQAHNNKEGSSMSNRIFKFSKTNTEETLDMSQLAELQSQLTAANEQLAEFSSVKEALTLLQTSVAEKETALAEAMAEVAQMKAATETMKMDTRKSKLAAVMSADKIEAVSASLSTLDDSAFETVLSGFAAQKQALEASEMFTEIGDQGTEAVVETTSKAKTSTEDLIKQKLGLV